MASIFTKIISGEIPSYKIYEDDNYFAFLDINPNALGHTLCVPKKEVDQVFDLDDDALSGLIIFSKKVVPHVHVHLIPINTMDDMSFDSKIQLTNDQFVEIMNKIKSYI